MEIGATLQYPMSPFPSRKLPITDEDAHGKTVTFAPNTSLVDYVKATFGVKEVKRVRLPYSFTNRDTIDKPYSPSSDDPFVFKNAQSLKFFLDGSKALITTLVKEWKTLGLPVVEDKDRGIEVPDDQRILDAMIDNDEKMMTIYKQHHRKISFIISQVDILKKAAVVRHIFPGWFATSYAGKNAEMTASLKKSIDVFIRAIEYIHSTHIYKQTLAATIADNGDPLDTNVGSPLFEAEVSESVPISKLKIAELISNIGDKHPNYASWLEDLSLRTKGLPNKDFIHAVVAIRRSQYGYKTAHVWKQSPRGLVMAHDFRGSNTTRVAWMAPYFFNLLISPIQSDWKTLRKLMPGLYHDGKTRSRYLQAMQKSTYYVVESDYKNYDRSIAPNIMEYFFAKYAKTTSRPDWAFSLLRACIRDVNIIYPDPIPGERGIALTFKPDAIGLVSGLKITSDEGTIFNALVCGATLLESGEMNENTLFDYWTSFARNPSTNKVPLINIQSDDTLFIDSDLKILMKRVAAFKKVTEAIGLKGEVGLGDRFLMRSMTGGADVPIESRVYQNTVSNEDPSTDPLIFCVGLGARTDGFAGYKTVDAFGLGKFRGMESFERSFQMAMLQRLYIQLDEHSSIRIKAAVEFIAILIKALSNMQEKGGLYYANPADCKLMDHHRMLWAKTLALQDLKTISQGNYKLSLLMKSSIQNQYSLSGVLLDSYFTSSASGYSALKDMVTNKETAFYNMIMQKAKIRTSILDW